MKPTQSCFDLIKRFEGCELDAYFDPGSGNLPITIGWGSTMYDTGEKIKMGDTISQGYADYLLEWEVEKKSVALNAMNLGLNQNQFNAITSFIYNVGLGNFNSSTMLKRLKKKDYDVGNEFLKWNKANNKVMEGLTKRRIAEKELYNTPV